MAPKRDNIHVHYGSEAKSPGVSTAKRAAAKTGVSKNMTSQTGGESRVMAKHHISMSKGKVC